VRRSIRPREVERLAAECATLLRWLRSPAGAAASEHAFAAGVHAFNALRRAVALLPRGRERLRAAGAVLRARADPEPVGRPAEAFAPEEVALLRAPLLTATGWLVPEPDALRRCVDGLRGAGSTDADALRLMLRRCGWNERRVAEDLPALKVRLSRARRR
jgi:hypothetical protein